MTPKMNRLLNRDHRLLLHLLRLHAADTAGALEIQYPANVKSCGCRARQDRRALSARSIRARRGRRVHRRLPHRQLPSRARQRARLERLKRAKKILDEIGVGGERLDIFFMSGSQALAFANAAKTMTERIRELGPNPLKTKDEGGTLRVKDEVADVEEETGYRGRH